ncbi:hypothetical protein HYH02_008080 [Chlamydomonas schloesseri]|uniref:Uncharacterized protein n=1 Tax=Chlamydomonas schloesseri TaxID=2026947 RepID=A0A835WH67_9CHLO|nr:hypothetical protein HYH02_008080 [Chlamydomonas schloesseri]|eukprot:KAG2446925.1 hypothetical protein HYH02_008080 [Chlamydomonas schloesseri]
MAHEAGHEFDVTPLQKAFLALAAKVDQCVRENAQLKAEVAELRVGKRLDALEQGLQELADVATSGGGTGGRAGSVMMGGVMVMGGGGGGGGGFWGGTPATEDVGMAAAATGDDSGDGAGDASDGLHRTASAAAAAAAASGGDGASRSTSGRTAAMPDGRSPAPSGRLPAAAAPGAPSSSAPGTPSMGRTGAAAANGGGGTGSPLSRMAVQHQQHAMQQQHGSRPSSHMQQGVPMMLMGAGGGGASHMGVVDPAWLVQEVVALRDRLGAMERKAEALWHVQEDDEALRGAVERLRADVVSLQGSVQEAQASAAAAANHAERQAADAAEGVLYVKELQDRVHTLELGAIKSTDERREVASKYESNVSQIWDQLRHVEGSLAQRLTMAETSHVAALQEVDEAKEATSEVMQRVDDVKRHTSALEVKLDSFNTQVAAAINPLHNALAAAAEKLEALSASKQDTAAAIKQADVELGVARAIEHADRRGDNLLKAIAGVEARLESLADSTPNKGEVVLTSDLEALLTEHARELDAHLDRLKGDLLGAVAAKADREELGGVDLRLGGRLEGLEGALLKGLRAISDKVSAALAEKLDLTKFSEFKLQVRAILADVEDRLRDWSPLALGTKAQLGTDGFNTGGAGGGGMGGGGAGAPTCLLCDSRVRTARDLRAMGFQESDRVFTPDRLPLTDPLLPSIQGNRAASMGAHLNARLAGGRNAADARLRTTSSLMESLPADGISGVGSLGGTGRLGSPVSGGGAGHLAAAAAAGGGGAAAAAVAAAAAGLGAASGAGHLAAAVDAGSFASLPPAQSREERLAGVGAARQASARGLKVKVETVSGNIMKGQITPVASGGGAGAAGGSGHAAGSGSAAARAPRSPVAAAATATGLPAATAHHLVVTGGLSPAFGLSAAAANGGGGGGEGESGGSGLQLRPISPWRVEPPSPTFDAGPAALAAHDGAAA